MASRAIAQCDLLLVILLEAILLIDHIIHFLVREIAVDLVHLCATLGPSRMIVNYLLIEPLQNPVGYCLVPQQVRIEILDTCVLCYLLDGYAERLIISLLCGFCLE
ncbi:hypothetical protein [Methanolobus psychrotolerans]|uniref:hypothetical protein n=1 Tax=Methanolobus psychrotolerans TaxID=1874706 RepID=UPI001F5DECB5|nr:hypothetical protein [Methanolobus psychrotolerans]